MVYYAGKTSFCRKNMHDASRSDISPDGEDTHTIRLKSKPFGLRVAYTKRIRLTLSRLSLCLRNMMHVVHHITEGY